MEASKFCKFFDFTLSREDGVADETFHVGPYRYRAVDDQGVFNDRLVMDVADLAGEFDSMLDDYIRSDLEEHGFIEYPKTYGWSEGGYWKKALEWVRNNGTYAGTAIQDVIGALVNPDSIVDDVTMQHAA